VAVNVRRAQQQNGEDVYITVLVSNRKCLLKTPFGRWIKACC